MGEGLYFYNSLARYIGQTVTIFTTSGGESGRGFTGVVASVNRNVVKLITEIGPGPGCALGNACDYEDLGEDFGGLGEGLGEHEGNGKNRSRRNRNGFNGFGLGSIVEIPIERIAAFVHNAVGASYQ